MLMQNDSPEMGGTTLEHPLNVQSVRGEADRLRFAERHYRLFNRYARGHIRPEEFGVDAGRWLVWGRATGAIKFRRHRLTIDDWPRAYRRGEIYESRSESSDHASLKFAAVDWLRARGCTDARHERTWKGLRIDACSFRAKVFVEVGRTPISKVVLAAGFGFDFYLVPFRKDFERHPERSILIEFRMNETARDDARDILSDHGW